MNPLAIAYHSAQGHTGHIARHVAQGARSATTVDVDLLKSDDLARDPDRRGSWSGLMAQAGHASPADTFAPGDLKTARMFGRHFAATLERVAVPA